MSLSSIGVRRVAQFGILPYGLAGIGKMITSEYSDEDKNNDQENHT